MIAFVRNLLERDNYEIGLTVVRGLSLLIGIGALVLALFASGAGIAFCLIVAALFLVSALYPGPFGRLAGGAILCVAFVVMISGPNGEAGLSSYGFWRSIPLYLLAGLFMRPALITLAFELFRPQR